MLDRRENIEQCHTNTCQWILESEKYKSWSGQTRGLLWIKGKPGAGKSTLMAFLHNRLKSLQNGIRLDFFFTARGTEMQRTPLGMFRSLLNQIFGYDVTVRPQVREAYKERCRQFGGGKWEWPCMLLEEILADVILASASRQHLTIFVDALDEAGAESARKLAAYFHWLIDRAEKKNVAVQICISCRHYPIVESSSALEIHVEDHNRDDIAIYIKDNLPDTEVGSDLSEATKGLLVGQLIKQANGLFQWARLIISLIRHKALEGESFDDIRHWLCEVPPDLEDVYTYILNNVIDNRNREQSFQLFQWLCLAERPLTVTEMRYALAAKNAQITTSPSQWAHGFVKSNEQMKRRIKSLSGGLAESVRSGDHHETVQVVHQSANEFLRTKGLWILFDNISASTSSIDRKDILFYCQATLYRSCLLYLSTLHISQAMLNHPEKNTEQLVQSYPLLNYATINLFVHGEKAAGSRADMLQYEYDILQQMISQWVHIYQIFARDTYHNHPWRMTCPPNGTTILHIAAAANLVDVIEFAASKNENITKQDGNGNTPFHLAARWGHITAGKVLQEKGADREIKGRDGRTPLVEAASFGHVEFVEWLLHDGEEIGTTIDRALRVASFEGHQGVVEVLLRAGADVNAQGGQYGNSLNAAIYKRNVEMVKLLLSAGADVNAQCGRYGNALQASVYESNVEIAQILLNAGADFNATGGEYGNALQASICKESTELMQMLLNAGANVNIQGGRYGSALQAAVVVLRWEGPIKPLQMLLNTGADVNTQGGEYGNALQAAAYEGYTMIVQMLLYAGADVNAQGGEYGNALQAAAAAAYEGYTATAQILINAGADVNAQGGKYGNALQAAAAALDGRTKLVQILLKAGAEVNSQGGRYGNALQAAACKRHSEIVQILVNSGADVNAQGGEYGNCLHAAAASLEESTETVQILLNAGADVNAQDSRYGTALQAATAAYHGNTDIVQMLLNSGADVNAHGGRNGTALQAAIANHGRNNDMVQMLLNAGADINASGGEYGKAEHTTAAAYQSSIFSVSCLTPNMILSFLVFLVQRTTLGRITTLGPLIFGISAFLLRYWYF